MAWSCSPLCSKPSGNRQRSPELQVPLSWRFEYCGLWHLVHEGVDFYFVDNSLTLLM